MLLHSGKLTDPELVIEKTSLHRSWSVQPRRCHRWWICYDKSTLFTVDVLVRLRVKPNLECRWKRSKLRSWLLPRSTAGTPQQWTVVRDSTCETMLLYNFGCSIMKSTWEHHAKVSEGPSSVADAIISPWQVFDWKILPKTLKDLKGKNNGAHTLLIEPNCHKSCSELNR